MAFFASQQGHIVNVLPPQDLAGGPVTGDRFSMKNHSHVSIILTIGANAAGTSVGVTVKECTAASGGTATARTFKYAAEETAAGDTFGELTDATTAGFDLHASNANISYNIELNAEDLSADYPWIELNIEDAAGTTDGSAVAILSGGRFQSDQNATAIA